MARRGVYSFVGFLILTYLVILRVYSIASGPQLAETAQQQSTYRLELAQTRGTFYDCAMRPLTGEEQSVVAAVAPVTEAAAALAEILPSGGMAEVYPMLTKGVPFSLSLPELCASSPGIDVFQIGKRYQDQQTAACVLGYLLTGAKGHGHCCHVFASSGRMGFINNHSKPLIFQVLYTVHDIGELLNGSCNDFGIAI